METLEPPKQKTISSGQQLCDRHSEKKKGTKLLGCPKERERRDELDDKSRISEPRTNHTSPPLHTSDRRDNAPSTYERTSKAPQHLNIGELHRLYICNSRSRPFSRLRAL